MAFTGLRWGEVVGLQASYVRGPDRRRNHPYIRVEWQMVELSSTSPRPRTGHGVTSTSPAGCSASSSSSRRMPGSAGARAATTA